KPAVPAQHITVQTDLYSAIFTSQGGRLESFRLKNYRTTVDPNSPPQEMVVAGQGGELPFGVELRGTQVLSDADVAYRVDGADLHLHGDQSGSFDVVGQTDTVTISKHFTFHGNRYEFSATVGLRNVPPLYTETGITWFKTVENPAQPGSEIIF